MEGRSVSPETLAAQALGEVDPVTGGLAPVINPSTNYERQADGSYRQDRQYTRADNPTFEPSRGAGCRWPCAAPPAAVRGAHQS